MSRHSQNPAMASSAFGSDECERVVRVRDRDAGVTAILAVHDTRLGPAHGGIRRWRYDSVEAAHDDAVRLARAMTWKCALADLPAGGGKAVIVDHDGLDRQAAYRLVGRAVEQLGGRFFTGPDVGTTDDDLLVVARETKNVVDVGEHGPGDLAAATAHGVFAAMTALAERLSLPMAGLRVAVQGVGAVGMQLCSRLSAAGARLTVSDVSPQRAAAAATVFGATVVPLESIVSTP
jgi:leucine dehydrogenase